MPMKNKDSIEKVPGLLHTLSSLQFGIVTLIVISVVAIIGTLLPQGRTIEFYLENYGGGINFLIRIFGFNNTYHSPLFIGLIGLFSVNLILCSIMKFPALLKTAFNPRVTPDKSSILRKPLSITLKSGSLTDLQDTFKKSGFPLRTIDNNRLYGEKGRMGYFGAFIVHLSLLILLAGSMTSLLTSVRGQITLQKGETTNQAMLPENKMLPLGFEISLESFDVEFYEDFPGRPKSYLSAVTVKMPDGDTYNQDIEVNHPLMINDLTIFQSSYGTQRTPVTVSTENDTARVAIRLKGIPESMPAITTFDMPMGVEFTVPGFGDSITVSLGELHRNFRQMPSPDGSDNPAVKVDVMVNGITRWSVYTFKNFPGMNMPMFEDIQLAFVLMDIHGGDVTIEDSGTEEFYTVLGVVRDKGMPLMWVGSAVMMLGLVLSFYIRPRHVWVLEDDGEIYVGAAVKGDSESFKQFVRKTVKKKEQA